MLSRHRLSVRSLSLTFLSLVSLSNALKLSIQGPVHIGNPFNLTWAIESGKDAAFLLFLKNNDADTPVLVNLGDVTVEDSEQTGSIQNGIQSITIPSDTSVGSYHIAAYWTTDPIPDSSSTESGTSNSFQLLSPLPPPPPTTITQTSTTTSSGSTILSVQTSISTQNVTTTRSVSGPALEVASQASNDTQTTSSTPSFSTTPSNLTPGETPSDSVPQSTTVTTTSPPAPAADTASNNSKPDTGVITGSVVGALVGIILLIIVIVYFLRRYRQHRYDKSAAFYQDMMIRPAENRGIVVHDDDAATIIGQMVEKGYGTSV